MAEDAVTNPTTAADLAYDPYDRDIDADPYPVYRRLREEAPLYYNEEYDFFAVSRFDDVQRGLVDRETYSSARGSVLEFIKANVEMPSGVVIFEDPPRHTVHRGLLSRVFTPNKMRALEPKVREFCGRALDPLVGTGRFDFVADLGAEMPMRTIGMLLGIPESDQETVRDRAKEHLRTDPGKPMDVTADEMMDGSFFADYLDWRAEHPSDDIMTELLFSEFEDETGSDAAADPRGGAHLRECRGRRRERDHEPPHRLDGEGVGRPPRGAARAGQGPLACPERHRGAAAVRASHSPRGPLRGTRRRTVRHDRASRQRDRSASAGPRTVTNVCTRMGSGSTSDARSASTSRSVTASISASAPPWRGMEGRIALDEVLTRFPEWDVDWANARRAQTSTVRGWDALPVFTA